MHPPILSALEALSAELAGLDELGRISRLRDLLPPEHAREAAELFALRRRAGGKLRWAARLDMTRRGLEQASHRDVALYRASRIAAGARALGSHAVVLDATAGIGADAQELVAAGVSRLVAADRDPRAARALRHNLRVAAEQTRSPTRWMVLEQDATRPGLRAADLVLLDPDRRVGDRRSIDPERWSPSWAQVLARLAEARGGCVKLAPATEPARLEGRLPERAELEWISRGGELHELALWSGMLAGEPSVRVATALRMSDGELRVSSVRGTPVEVPALAPEEAERAAWLHDPDPALVRSGLLGLVAREEGLAPLDPHIAYLAGPAPARSPLLQGWRVLGSAPLDRRRVRALLREHGIGPLTVKKRGHPDDAATLAKRLKGPGDRRGTLVVARLGARHRAYLVEREDAPEHGPGGEILSG